MSLQDIDQLRLWQRLKETGSPQNVANVEALIDGAAALLDRVIETFPTYTLHNRQHAFNVARLMGDLLGEEGLAMLGPLESAMLLLSAYFHDIGMVFRADERASLEREPEWKTFLDTYAEAFLAVEKSTDIPLDVAEWYCRWRHADRVFLHLNTFPPDKLHWGAVSFREDLGILCRSHNSSVKDLQNLETKYLGECDLRFCAVLLRLADILDFDSSRAPEMVYRYLGLEDKETTREQRSDTEWRKHLASNGFKFPSKHSARYDISITAGPDDPAVEHDLRKFLDVIEAELQECAALLSSCSERWRDFLLPGGIDRRGIKSSGYHYGEYQFTLEQNQVLDLLMGENLYQDPYVFVRELLQNAIDTCRHREYVERLGGDSKFRVKPITVSEWDDAEGYHWVRFDDFGMGMNEQIIRDFLLKVGCCYYASAQFKADLLRAQKKGAPDFCPISRFGIGLLSCFLAGDRVEISTVHQGEYGKRETPVRLSLNGLHGFYMLQMAPLPFKLMPAASGVKDDGQHRDFGTSVAVRIDPRKEQGVFTLRALLERHLFCPPIPVEFDGERIGGDSAKLLDRPFIKKTQVKLRKAQMRALSEKLGYVFREPVIIEFIPLDITAHSPCKEMKGQLVLTRFLPSKKWRQIADASEELRLEGMVVFHDGRLCLKVEVEVSVDARPEECTNPAARRIMEQIRDHGIDSDGKMWNWEYIELDRYASRLLPVFSRVTGKNPRWLVHNGITMPVRLAEHSNEDASWDELILWFWPRLGATRAIWGAIYLSDSFRPNVSVARDVLHNLPTRVQSAIELGGLRAKKAAGTGTRSQLLNHSIRNEAVLLGAILNDDLITRADGWRTEPILQTGDDVYQSVNEVKALTATGKSIELPHLPSPGALMRGEWRSFFDCYAAALVQLELCTELREPKHKWEQWELIATPDKPPPLLEAHKLFPPLTFVPFVGKPDVLTRDGRLNSKHPVAQWLLEKALVIHQRYPGILRSIREALLTGEDDDGDNATLYREVINQNLDRLATLHPDVRPPKTIYLRSRGRVAGADS